MSLSRTRSRAPLALQAMLWVALISCSEKPAPQKTASNAVEENARKIYPKYVELERRERKIDETIWAKEIQAQRCGLRLERLWDALNYSTNKLQILANFAAGEVTLPALGAPEKLPHGIEIKNATGPGRKLNATQWRGWVEAMQLAGWQLGKTEFRHTKFDPDALRSEFYSCGELFHPGIKQAATLEGTLVVSWESLPPGEEPPAIRAIDATGISLRSRIGEAPFELVFSEVYHPREKTPFIDPLILYDLDNDGRSEVILAAKNLLLQFDHWKVKASKPLCAVDPGLISTALLADFNNDGFADFLCARADGLLLYPGSGSTHFEAPPVHAWQPPARLKYALVMTCGDIDRDGDLDVWLTQYKVPYLLGQLPTPYFDANDGHPSYLLKNHGNGSFVDATIDAGLASKRNRRTYSASFVDLDADADLDLAVVSDFAGLDLYRNNGSGVFTDVTRTWAGKPYATGMAHALADFDRDGRTDLLVMGMTSATVDRLEYLDLKRRDSRIDESKRAPLMSGNRLLVATLGGGYAEAPLGETIRRSGWSWGIGAADYDNDGSVDVYVANGHETKGTVRDYESEYWLHDLYIGNSIEDTVNMTYFAAAAGRTRGRGFSFGGWDRNRFFWNDNGKRFVEVGHLFGVSLQEDCRNVVANDLDGDGRLDLMVTTFEEFPIKRQTLKVYRNRLSHVGTWISARFNEEAGRISPIGAEVTVYSNGGRTVRPLVTGDSFRSQHPSVVHFGLGMSTNVDRLEIRWSNGQIKKILQPAVNRYHPVQSPKK